MATFSTAGILTDTGLAISTADPDYGARKASKPNVRTVRFGDGYQQRLTLGLNQNPKTWTLKWENRSEADADAIERFFDRRADDNTSFSWTSPDEDDPSKYICLEWSKDLPYSNLATISATFQEVYEP
tara:strand:+ start:2865 stop:3248 length:384 start_codon:yes stop_codon:yes gene_type:complete